MKESFSLDINHQFVCNNSKKIQLLCTISSNALSFGFDSWTHTFNGVFIRHVKGTSFGNTSVILIDTCQFYDSGQYKCRAWKREESGFKWIEKTSELKVIGKNNVYAYQIFNDARVGMACANTYLNFFIILPSSWY